MRESRCHTATWIGARVCLALSVGSAVYAQRPVPPAGPDPYASMSDAELDAIEEARRQGTAHESEFDRSLLPLINGRLQAVRASVWPNKDRTAAPSPASSQDLADELFLDWQNWEANSLWQDVILDEIRNVTKHPQLAPEARAVVRQGLLEYLNGGGGQESPYHMADLGETLSNAAEFDDWTTHETARQLFDDALKWAEQSGKERFVKRTQSRREAVFGPLEWAAGDAQEDPLRNPPAEVPEVYRAARQTVYEIARIDHVHLSQLDPLRDAVRNRSLDESLFRDLLIRLLLTYERILKFRHVSKEVVDTIDCDLVRLVKDEDRIDGQRLWMLWSRAAAALGRRASEEMRRLIDRELTRGAEGHKGEAFEAVARAIFPDHSVTERGDARRSDGDTTESPSHATASQPQSGQE